MAFRFSLEPVLRLRRSEQRQQELVLQRINEQVNRIILEINAIDDEMSQVSTARKSESAFTGAEIRFDQQRCDILAERRARTVLRLNEARERQSAAATEFQRMWQRRETLETMRRREQQAYELEERRRDQRVLDELFLQRRRRR